MKKWTFKLIRWFFYFLIKDRLRLSQIFIKNIISAMIVVSWKIIDDVDISLPCRKLQKSHKDAPLDTIYQLFSSFYTLVLVLFCFKFRRYIFVFRSTEISVKSNFVRSWIYVFFLFSIFFFDCSSITEIVSCRWMFRFKVKLVVKLVGTG